MRLHLDTWRWSGVPIFLRSGKCLPITATEITVDLRPPPQDVFAEVTRGNSNCIRFRIGDEMSISVSAKVYDPDMRQGEDVELYAQRKKTKSVPPYERLLTDAMCGNRMLFSNQEAVDAMWRVVDPILDDVVPVQPYKPGTWGPVDANRMVAHYGGWRNPV